MFEANNREDRTEYSIYQIFTSPDGEFAEEVIVYIPFEMLVEAVVKFCDSNYNVKIDGTNNSVWNLFSDTNFIDNLFDDEDFIDMITEDYRASEYAEIDYEDWCELEPWEE